jgi:hypothetical protein
MSRLRGLPFGQSTAVRLVPAGLWPTEPERRSVAGVFYGLAALSENEMGDSRDIQHGVYDPVGGVDMKHRFKETQTPHERAQTAADVRANAVPSADDEFLPEALRRQPASPLNKRTGRNPTE